MNKKFLIISGLIIVILIFGLLSIDIIIAKLKTSQVVQEFQNSENYYLKLDSVDEQKINQLLIVEDPIFYTHKGLDFKSPGAGWTTISQGLVKLLYFKKFQPGISKIRLILITRFVFDSSVSKDTQLELFYNYAYLGNDNEGVAISGFLNASRFYFKKDFNNLSNDEYLSLVTMLINPNQYRIDKYPEKNSERLLRIKKLINGECKPNDWKDCELEGCK